MASYLEVEDVLFGSLQEFNHVRLLSRVNDGISYSGYYLEKHKNMFNIYFFYDTTEGDDYGFITEKYEGEDLVGSFTYDELISNCIDPYDKDGYYILEEYRRFCRDILHYKSALGKL